MLAVFCVVKKTTCNNEVYDYFVVSKTIRHAIKGIQRIKDSGLQPHFPVRLFIQGNARRLATRKLVKAPKVSGALPRGPPGKPGDYKQVITDARAGKITEAVTKWYILARREWSNIANLDLQYKEPKLVWGSAVGRVADPHA